MRIPLIASFIVFIIWLGYKIRKAKNTFQKREKEFWDREREANNVRRKPIENLPYIQIPDRLLSLDVSDCDDEAKDCLKQLRILSELRIMNFTGYSNTDLKMEYGTANITVLSEYDQNYTLLVSVLQKLAQLLYDNENYQDALSVAEFALSTGTDVSATYRLLTAIYEKQGILSERLPDLTASAEKLRSANKAVILRFLNSRPA